MGDVITVFSQFGEIVDINLVRDRATGKSRGFCFLAYEDQRSTILAVDNMSGYELLKRIIKVEHVLNYKAPRKFDKDNFDEDGQEKLLDYEATGAEGKGIGIHTVVDSQKRLKEIVPTNQTPERIKDGDDLWAAEFEKALASRESGTMRKKKRKKDNKKDKKKTGKNEDLERRKGEDKKSEGYKLKRTRSLSSSSSSRSSSSSSSSAKKKKKKRKK